MKTFNNIDELKAALLVDGHCKEGIEYGFSFDCIENLLENVTLDYRVHCILHGYVQFEDFDWNELTEYHWFSLLKNTNKYDDKCDFSKLSPRIVKNVLRYRSDLIDKFDLNILSKKDIKYIKKYNKDIKI
jgi:hypothetical protein